MIKYLLLGVVSLFSLNSYAAIVNVSGNPAVSPGAVAYLGDPARTPLRNPDDFDLPLPNAQSVFNPDDPIRIAVSISLTDLDQARDDSGSPDWNLDSLVWSVDWYNPDEQYVDSNFVDVAWSDIELWQTDSNASQVAFSTDLLVPETYGPLAEGTWFADTYFEGVLQSTVEVQVVPIPGAIVLLLSGLFLIGRKLKTQNIKAI